MGWALRATNTVAELRGTLVNSEGAGNRKIKTLNWTGQLRSDQSRGEMEILIIPIDICGGESRAN